MVVSTKLTTEGLFSERTILLENMSYFVWWYQNNYTEEVSFKVRCLFERFLPDVGTMWDAESSINDKPDERGGEEQRESTAIPSS